MALNFTETLRLEWRWRPTDIWSRVRPCFGARGAENQFSACPKSILGLWLKKKSRWRERDAVLQLLTMTIAYFSSTDRRPVVSLSFLPIPSHGYLQFTHTLWRTPRRDILFDSASSEKKSSLVQAWSPSNRGDCSFCIWFRPFRHGGEDNYCPLLWYFFGGNVQSSCYTSQQSPYFPGAMEKLYIVAVLDYEQLDP